MGATTEDTQHEIGALRQDMTDAAAELQRRLGGGVRGVVGADARVSGSRAGEQATQRIQETVGQATEHPGLLAVAGVVATAGVAYGVYAGIQRWRESRKPQNQVKRRIAEAKEDLGDRLDETLKQLAEKRRKIREARERGVLLKVEPEGGGYLRVTDAKLDLPSQGSQRKDVVKNLIWAGLLSIFMAFAGVFARRLAGTVWRATLREEPPTEQK